MCICGTCKNCRRTASKKKYAASTKGIAHQTQYAKDHSEKKKKIAREWALAHPERRKEIEKKYRQSDKGKASGIRRQQKRYWSDPEYYRIKALSRLHGIPVPIFETLPKSCGMCGTVKNLTIDHMIPVARGGTSVVENLQTLCGSCNSFKGTKIILANNQGVVV